MNMQTPIKRKPMSFEYTTEYPNLIRLVEQFGQAQASKMMGLSDVNKMIRDNKVRPAYEIAAGALLDKLNVKEREVISYIIKLTPDQKKLILPLLDSLKVTYMDLDL